MKATHVVTCTGGTLTVEAGEGRCWHVEEVAECEIDVDEGTICDICEEEIQG